ncbi:dTDP-4-dehydrorhamnose reductase [Providencia huaxiensis]|uniref:dTDP-4-dehydrorhamnose reductase n=1 Tax=Providencia huaxiensis TaxID=2027290 RepID=UPI0034E53A92
MKILLLGKNGQVGWELQRALLPLGELIALDRHSKDYCGDLSKLDDLAKTIELLKPDVIVNAAAYTAVDKAESEPELSRLINSEAVKVLAQSAQKINALLVHYSTDYVFSGEGEHLWHEDDQASALNSYGETKLEGENYIQQYCSQYLILRTSWVYSTHGNNFINTMLKLGKEKQSLSIISDQYVAPTSAELLADSTSYAIKKTIENPNFTGVYNLVASDFTNWYEYAKLIFETASKNGIELSINEINKIASSDYPLPAKRPLNSRLNNNKFQCCFDVKLPNWKIGVIRTINEITTLKYK